MKRILFTALIFSALSLIVAAQSYNDRALAKVAAEDRADRLAAAGTLPDLPVEAHLYRGDVYMANRHFPEARAHYQKILELYPQHENVPGVLFKIGRSFMWEREYEQAADWFDRLFRDFTATEEGRNGLLYKGASFVRAGKSAEAAATYKQYAVMFPEGERIESAYLNIIDALRETGRYDEADRWVEKSVKRFSGTPTEVDALHAKLRMEIYRENWPAATAAADRLLGIGSFKGSMAWTDEIKYLKAYSLEQSGRKRAAQLMYFAIPDHPGSYYGGLATDKLRTMGLNEAADQRSSAAISTRLAGSYPVKYRTELLQFAKNRGVDPRFVLAIMMQESSFRPHAKSPAAARGLLQLVFDTALKYSRQAGYPNLRPNDLYRPATNISIGTIYIRELKDQFGGMYEPIAVSYNAGEDNAARWLQRTNPKDPGVFAAEVGFRETKNYVFKVMSNYRVYRQLYTEDLSPQ